ncbi:putative glutathione S-transferase [Streptomyces thermodiastaticus]|uniref:Glutathione S-transferase n=1 Tax=Streptomyces thermodiastaticus TaxID=44061 RepID=A0ABU0KQA0_9ACTN|nr:putative glutathione S-transferase [Streptomyces thermodiastaticus]UVT12834.1 glutathione S-transferase C-terminal domain-containing protein [Streptomyces thermocarboxydus]WSB44649.1 glutathione S-transferase C-terminal domain-containing protein [Streptomyces cellulosae]WTF23654.1 glutathione S-transferase C-terminal domain-containing protein [Streptomyces cellulosae]
MSATSPTSAEPPFRSRIGDDPRSGYYAAPHRYRLHLSLTCPHCLQIAVTHSLLGLADVLPVTLLPAVPDAPDGGRRALRPLYEASAHLYPGPALAPVLHDNWTGTVVSTHAPDIVRDLARRFGGHGDCLLPRESDEAFAAVERLCEQGVNATAQRAGLHGGDRAERDTALATLLRALDLLELRLASQEYVLGDDLTLADVRLWVTLVQLDTVHRHHLDASAVHRITEHPRLWAYARRLTAHPAFGPHLDLDGIARRHHAHCRGTEAAGAAVPIMDWPAYIDRRTPEPTRRPV